MESIDPAPETAEQSSAGSRAQQLRAALSARREVEMMLAEAAHLRQQAAEEAESLVAEAQQISDDLITEARDQSARATEAALEQARVDAAQIVDQARIAASATVAAAERDRSELRSRAHRELVDAVQQVADVHSGLADATTSVASILDRLSGESIDRSALRKPERPAEQPVATAVAETDSGIAHGVAGEPAAGEPADDEPANDASDVAEVEDVTTAQADVSETPEGHVADEAGRDSDSSAPTFASTPFASVAAPVSAFATVDADSEGDLIDTRPVDVRAVVDGATPSAVVAETETPQAEAPQAEVPTDEPANAGVPSAEVPSAEVPSAEVPSAEVPSAEVPSAEVPVAERPVMAFANRMRDSEASSAGAVGRSGSDESDRAIEAILDGEASPDESQAEPPSRPLGWLFRSTQ